MTAVQNQAFEAALDRLKQEKQAYWAEREAWLLRKLALKFGEEVAEQIEIVAYGHNMYGYVQIVIRRKGGWRRITATIFYGVKFRRFFMPLSDREALAVLAK